MNAYNTSLKLSFATVNEDNLLLIYYRNNRKRMIARLPLGPGSNPLNSRFRPNSPRCRASAEDLLTSPNPAKLLLRIGYSSPSSRRAVRPSLRSRVRARFFVTIEFDGASKNVSLLGIFSYCLYLAGECPFPVSKASSSPAKKA